MFKGLVISCWIHAVSHPEFPHPGVREFHSSVAVKFRVFRPGKMVLSLLLKPRIIRNFRVGLELHL